LPGCCAQKAQHHGTRNRRCDQRRSLKRNAGAKSSARGASAGAVGSALGTAASKEKLVKEGRMRLAAKLLNVLTCVILLLVGIGLLPISGDNRRSADVMARADKLVRLGPSAPPEIEALVASVEGWSQVGRSNLTWTRLPGCCAQKAQHHGTRNRRCEGPLQRSTEPAMA
jgi:hypothetical protein